MRITIERLRRWFLVLAVMLVAGLAGAFFYARYQVRKTVRDLPGKLGIDIQQSAKEFTFSKSDHGRTLFTLRASKAVQYKGGGRVLLHDFAILLYAKDGRADRISGTEFEFDPAARLATANGDVHIDLHAPQPKMNANPSERMDEFHEDAETLHVLAHGLVFDQATGNAETQNEIEFHFPQAAGTAHGAKYDAEAGVLVLQSDVDVSASTEERDFRIRATHASLQRDSRQLDLTAPRFESAGETASAAHAVAQLDPDGRPVNIRASGGVTMESADHVKVTAREATSEFDKDGKVHQVRLTGGVRSTEQQPERMATAEAGDAVMLFDRGGTLQHVALAGGVAIHDVDVQAGKDGGETRRDLKAERVEANFVPTKQGHTEAQTLKASGAAVVHLVQPGSGGHAKQSEESTVSADSLIATLSGGKQISHLQGAGNAQLSRVTGGGTPQSTVQTASSDELEADFASKSGHNAIASAVQRGNVTITQTAPAAKAAAPQISTAYAQLAEYRAASETVTLTGDASQAPQLRDGALELAAQRIVLARVSGDAVATGELKATYLAAPNEPPLHVVADRGEMFRSQQRAVFTGHARLWQQDSSIEAPVLEMTRTGGHLTAHGDPGTAAVHGVFVSSTGVRAGTPVRITSERLTYSDNDRLANFDGGTVVESADARIRADDALVTLRDRAGVKVAAPQAKAPKPDAAKALFPGISGAVESIAATGHILLEQPGRKGTGAKLVYTAVDGRFVLTGTSTQPPQLTDAVRGTITGPSLIFLSRNDSVQVGDDKTGRTTTRTRVQK